MLATLIPNGNLSKWNPMGALRTPPFDAIPRGMANDREARARREMARLGMKFDFELAKKAGLSQGAVSKFMNAKSGGRATTIAAIAKALGVSSDYLETGTSSEGAATADTGEDITREQVISFLGDSADPRAVEALRLERVPPEPVGRAYWHRVYREIAKDLEAMDNDAVLTSLHSKRERERRAATTPDLRPVEKQRRRKS